MRLSYAWIIGLVVVGVGSATRAKPEEVSISGLVQVNISYCPAARDSNPLFSEVPQRGEQN